MSVKLYGLWCLVLVQFLQVSNRNPICRSSKSMKFRSTDLCSSIFFCRLARLNQIHQPPKNSQKSAMISQFVDSLLNSSYLDLFSNLFFSTYSHINPYHIFNEKKSQGDTSKEFLPWLSAESFELSLGRWRVAKPTGQGFFHGWHFVGKKTGVFLNISFNHLIEMFNQV